jgi:glycosyltransferase involved in cell wall biosynthesis
VKRVLMVAYHFPPEGGGSGVLRTLKFTKYLPRHGWIPHILTLKRSFYVEKDNGLLSDIPPEAVVHRTFALDSSRHLAIRGRYLSLFSVPDRFVSWLPFGVLRGMRLIRNTGIDVLYSTSPPATAHLIAGALKRLTGLPWVVDFRDPWIEEGFFPIRGTLRYRVESFLERLVVHSADRLIFTTPYLRKDFLSRYPNLSPDKAAVIYNGYDEADFQHLDDQAQNERFEIIHAGLVTPEFRSPIPMLKVIASLVAEGNLLPEKIRITFLGGGPYLVSKRFTKTINDLRLNGAVEVADRVSHHQALQRLRKAAVLLLLQASDDTRFLIPAKAFEYLRIGRPVLALTLEGATADLFKGMDYCYVVNPIDESRLRNAVMSLYKSWCESPDRIQVSPSIQRYERSNLTAELAQLLGELVD